MYRVLILIVIIINGTITENIFNDIRTVYKRYYTQDNWDQINRPSDWNTKPPRIDVYDFIIIGSGSAGSIIANRLSEVPEWQILLLEAGRGENQISRIPLLAPAFQFTEYNWNYVMEPQDGIGYGLEGGRMLWPRGKALGGTTVINYMIYTRGSREDYDRWSNQGNPGWSYDEVLPYFIKSENSSLHIANHELHGHDGYQSVEDIYQSKLVESFIEGTQELGLPHIDYNANLEPLGSSTVQATTLNGRRHSVARAFLNPIKNRPNLHILTSAFVTKILINPQTHEAYGVEYERKKKRYRVRARREIILSAGAFNSPKLLMLSGIGPRKHLENLGIDCLADLPVGEKLQDHLTYPALSFLIDRKLSLSTNIVFSGDSIAAFLYNGTGPITSLGGVEGIGYIQTELSEEPTKYPDIELIFVGATLASDYGVLSRRSFNMRDDVYDGLFAPTHDIPQWTIFPMLLHPKSTGYMKLKSADPYDPPLLYGNFFTDPDGTDLDTFVAAIRYIQRLARTKAFNRYGSRLNPNAVPGCERYHFDSDDYWRCAVRSLAATLHHQVSTCKMGPTNDPESVVDNELRVYNVARLRVADASIIPFAIGAHTNAPSMMIGEKAADLIKKTWLFWD